MNDATAPTDADPSRALEQVMREVLGMKQAGDVEHMIEAIWNVLREREFDFVSCALLLLNEERDWITSYNIWEEEFLTSFGFGRHMQPFGKNLRMLVIQATLSTAPATYQEALTAWRRQTVERHALTREEIETLVRLNKERLGDTFTVADYPIRFHLHVPFAHGVFTLRTQNPDPDPFSDAQVSFLRRLMGIVSAGYGRYLELLRLERDRAVQQVRAEVQAMKQGEDIHTVMGLLWQELLRAGLDFDYMSIAISDVEADFVHLYGMWCDQYRVLLRGIYPLLREDIAPETDLFYTQVSKHVWDEYHTDFAGIRHVKEDELSTYTQRTARLWQVDSPLTLPDLSMDMAAALLPQGRIFAAKFHATPGNTTFTPADLATLEAFADALSLGFTRFFDFQRLEQRTRELEIERAVEQVQNAVQSMKTSADILSVIFLLSEKLMSLGLDYYSCSVSFVDRDAGRVRVYVTPGLRIHKRWAKLIPSLEYSFGPDAIERLESEEGPIFISGIPGAEGQRVQYVSVPLDAYHGRVQQIEKTTIVLRTEEEAEKVAEEYKRAWKMSESPRELWVRSVLRSPFSGGTIALSDSHPDFFTEEDARILERFAEAFSLGYARHLDFRKLEQQNRALEEANERLVEANREIQENTRRKSDFMARMSHDLRTPMNAIIGYTRIILRKAREKLDDRQLRNLENIETSSHNLLNLINEILDLSRIEAGRIDVNPQDVDLQPLAADCTASVASLVKPGVELIQQIEDVPSVHTDPEILRKVLMNLLSNAVKFTEQGSITLSVRPVDGRVELSVADTGIGIPEEDLPYIFEEFRQVERQGRPEVEGTGLGLAIAKKSVELLGGTITCDSEVGRGTCFTMTISAYAAP